MGRKDVVTRQYLSSADVFADVVNLALYSGIRVVCATDLTEMDASEEIAITLEKSNTEPKQRKQTRGVQKYRDIMREVKVNGEDGYLARIIVGVEEQSETHYAMPVRNMLYDALNYGNQVRRIGELNRREGITLSAAEFLSGIRKEDILLPVVTIVVTFQPEAWEGPMNVHDMLDWKGIPSEIRARIPNYEMLLLQPSDYDEEKVYEEIKESLGVDVVRLEGKPDNMSLVHSDIDKKLNRVCLIFANENTTLEYQIVVNYQEKSHGYDIEDE